MAEVGIKLGSTGYYYFLFTAVDGLFLELFALLTLSVASGK
jgi:hypothetical protein